MSKTYYIFRHGETFATKRNTWYWSKYFSAPILESGKPALLRMAEYFKPIKSDFNVRSPFLRCRLTCDIISSITGKAFEVDSRLSEYGFELPGQFKTRVMRFIIDMEQSNHKNIFICSHAAVIILLNQYFSEGKIHMRNRLAAPLPGVLTIVHGKTIEMINFNEEHPTKM